MGLYNIVVDTHMHTIASGHAYNTFDEMLNAANEKGLKVVCITEHGPAMPGAAHQYYYTNMRVIEQEYFPSEKPEERIYATKLIKGFEANILDYEGNTDYDDLGDTIADLVYIIASFHPCCLEPGTEKENTNAYLGAIKKPYVMTLGHIDDGRIPCDFETIIKSAKEHDVLIELNNSSMNPNGFRLNAQKNALEYLQICKENEAMIVLGSDAHYKNDIGNFDNLYPLLEKVNFPEELIVNGHIFDRKFEKWVAKKLAKRLQSEAEIKEKNNVI